SPSDPNLVGGVISSVPTVDGGFEDCGEQRVVVADGLRGDFLLFRFWLVPVAVHRLTFLPCEPCADVGFHDRVDGELSERLQEGPLGFFGVPVACALLHAGQDAAGRVQVGGGELPQRWNIGGAPVRAARTVRAAGHPTRSTSAPNS